MRPMAQQPNGSPAKGGSLLLVAAWLGVGLPLAWGVAMTISKALALFR
jgi:hypothetical protein